ncbi:MAG: hypothetical protein WAL63_08265 [Solirubrobacteraceae bacterium]
MASQSPTLAVVKVDTGFLSVPGQRAGFVLLGMFLLSFLFIRTSARLIRNPKVSWWPGNVETAGGLHVHHVVWGIWLLLIAGFLGFVLPAESPRNEILAGIFGVGAGLTLDEFALWLYVDDVYWAEEGRASFGAVVVAALLGGLVLLGGAPFGNEDRGASIVTFAVSIGTVLLFSVLAIVKGKPLMGLVGLFIPLVSLVGAIRLASPTSIWGRRFYDPEGRKMERAQRRWRRIGDRRRRLSDTIAGAPGSTDEAP